jgi:hypothetical protein
MENMENGKPKYESDSVCGTFSACKGQQKEYKTDGKRNGVGK